MTNCYFLQLAIFLHFCICVLSKNIIFKFNFWLSFSEYVNNYGSFTFPEIHACLDLQIVVTAIRRVAY